MEGVFPSYGGHQQTEANSDELTVAAVFLIGEPVVWMLPAWKTRPHLDVSGDENIFVD